LGKEFYVRGLCLLVMRRPPPVRRPTPSSVMCSHFLANSFRLFPQRFSIFSHHCLLPFAPQESERKSDSPKICIFFSRKPRFFMVAPPHRREERRARRRQLLGLAHDAPVDSGRGPCGLVLHPLIAIGFFPSSGPLFISEPLPSCAVGPRGRRRGPGRPPLPYPAVCLVTPPPGAGDLREWWGRNGIVGTCLFTPGWPYRARRGTCNP